MPKGLLLTSKACSLQDSCWPRPKLTRQFAGGTYIEAVVASVMFQLPVIRHLVAWIGCHPAGTLGAVGPGKEAACPEACRCTADVQAAV